MLQLKIEAIKTELFNDRREEKENTYITFSINMFNDFLHEILDQIFIHKIIIKTKNITKEERISLFKNTFILIKNNMPTIALFKIDNKIIYENKQVEKFYGNKYNCFKTKFSEDEFFFKKYNNNKQVMPLYLEIDEDNDILQLKFKLNFDQYSIPLNDVIFTKINEEKDIS